MASPVRLRASTARGLPKSQLGLHKEMDAMGAVGISPHVTSRYEGRMTIVMTRKLAAHGEEWDGINRIQQNCTRKNTLQFR